MKESENKAYDVFTTKDYSIFKRLKGNRDIPESRIAKIVASIQEIGWVRNPMYTGWWFLIIGVSFMWHNIWTLPMIFVDWLILTLVLKNTEEKWLFEVYGEEYMIYKKRVNRCIPWFPKKPIDI